MEILNGEGRNKMTVTYSIRGQKLTASEIASIALNDKAISMACNAVRKRSRKNQTA